MGESSSQLHYLQTLDLWEIGLFQCPCSDFSGLYRLLGDDSGKPHPDLHCLEEKEDGEVIVLTPQTTHLQTKLRYCFLFS